MVAAGDNNLNKVWKTDSLGNPGWRDEGLSISSHDTEGAYLITNDSSSAYLWYKDVVVDPSNPATLLSKVENPPAAIDSTIYFREGDSFYIADYRSRAAFTSAFLVSTPDATKIEQVYQVMLLRSVDAGALEDYLADPSTYPSMNEIVSLVGTSAEYVNHSDSIINHPIYIYGDNDFSTPLLRSDDYESYVNNHPGLSADYANYTAGGGQQTKNEWGADHYRNYGRGEGRHIIKLDSVSAFNYTYKCINHPNTMTGSIIVFGTDIDDGSPAYPGGVGTIPGPGLEITLEDIRNKINELSIKSKTNLFSTSVSGLVPGPSQEEEDLQDLLAADGNWVTISNYPNTKLKDGVVTAGGGFLNKVWKTDGSGNPGWGDIPSGGASVTTSTTAPTNPSDGDLWFDESAGKMYVYVDTVSAWVQTNGGGGASWSSGWFDNNGSGLQNGATYSFTHDLGTADLNITCYIADDANGTNAIVASPHDVVSTTNYGLQAQNVTASGFDIVIGTSGVIIGPTGTTHTAVGKFIKIIASSGGGTGGGTGGGSGSGGNLYDTGWITCSPSTSGLGKYMDFTHSLGEQPNNITVLLSGSASGADAWEADLILDAFNNNMYGYSVAAMGSSTMRIWMSAYGVLEYKGAAMSGDPSSNGSAVHLWGSGNAAYVRVIATTGAGGGTGGTGGGSSIVESPELQFTATGEYNASTNPYSVRNGPYPRWEHNLGQTPEFYSMSLRCKVAEEGWNVGDEFTVDYNGTYDRGEYAVYADSTYVGFIYKSSTTNNPFTVGKKEQSGNNPPNITGNSFLPDPAKWKIVFRASTGLGGGTGGGANWSSGWFDNNGSGLQNGANYSFTHDLGTTDLTTTIWVADDASGTNAKEVTTYFHANGGHELGATLTSISTTATTLQLLADGWVAIDSSGEGPGLSFGSPESWSGHHVKVVLSASGGGTGGGASWSTGWVNTDGTVNVTDAATLTFDHNLGTTDLNITCYVADDENGTNSYTVSPTDATSASRGIQVQSLSTTSATVQLGGSGYMTLSNSGQASGVSFSGKYIKIIASSGGGTGGTGGGAGWSSGWVTSDGTTSLANAATLTFNHNLGTSDVVFSIYAQKSDGTVYDAYGEFTSTSDYGAGINNITDNTITITCAENGASWIHDSDGNYSGRTADWGTANARKIKIVLK